MSGISDNIEAFIRTMFEEGDAVELRRNELAQYFGCAPSQINYVLTTRFSLERGYVITSKRGGGGYILVTRIANNENALHELVVNELGQEISLNRARGIINNLLARELITRREASIMLAAVADCPMVPANLRDYVRAVVLKNMVCSIACDKS